MKIKYQTAKKMTVLERHGIIDVNKKINSEVSIAHNE